MSSQDDAVTEPVVRAEEAGATLIVTLNRPTARNCVDRAVAVAVGEALDRLDAAPHLQVGVLTGAGGSFSAGLDLKAFARGESPVVGDRGFAGIAERAARKPLVAAVEGFALAGGLEIALACDLIVAARDARLGLPEVKVGLMAGAGGLLRLPQRVGVGQAAMLALTGAAVSGEEGYRIGLVDRLAEPGHALAEALELAAVIGRNAPLAVAASKAAVFGGFGRSAEEFWAWQRPHFRAVVTSADAREGAVAFAEKRPPVWQGR